MHVTLWRGFRGAAVLMNVLARSNRAQHFAVKAMGDIIRGKQAVRGGAVTLGLGEGNDDMTDVVAKLNGARRRQGWLGAGFDQNDGVIFQIKAKLLI